MRGVCAQGVGLWDDSWPGAQEGAMTLQREQQHAELLGNTGTPWQSQEGQAETSAFIYQESLFNKPCYALGTSTLVSF